MTFSGHPMGNRDPNKRGLNKNAKNLKRASKKGCRFMVLVALAGIAAVAGAATYTVSYFL